MSSRSADEKKRIFSALLLLMFSLQFAEGKAENGEWFCTTKKQFFRSCFGLFVPEQNLIHS